MNDVVQKQKSGDHSVNIQAQTINTGLQYSEVKEIFTDLFRENFTKLKHKSLQEVNRRLEEFNNYLLNTLQQRRDLNLETFKDPDLQYIIYEAQKSYARRGDNVLLKLLTEIIVKRTCEDGSLKKIVLNEAIITIPKLTITQLNSMTLKFILSYTRSTNISNIHGFHEYLKQIILPFCENLTANRSDYQHIEYTGCGSISIASTNIYSVMKENYPLIFSNGFDENEINVQNIVQKNNKIKDVFIPCLRNPSKSQINISSSNDFDEIKNKYIFDDLVINELKNLHSTYMITEAEFYNELISVDTNFKNLLATWENSDIQSLQLTSVGIAISVANYIQKLGGNIDLSIWIKD